ncbi:MAG TPA: phosphoribosylamine--glycine ligase [bacterium]|nr:phosphoribosylamine--glycine ligase [bacterium]
MKVLVVGSGGREHCLAWKLASSSRVKEVLVAPGNAGTAQVGRNLAVDSGNVTAICDSAVAEKVDLVVVGPEAPLSEGVVDALAKKGIPAFGPSGAAARLEGSKSFAKEIMKRHGIPTAAFGIFDEYEPARCFLLEQYRGGREMVIKADGLAAGKGVFVPDSQHEAERALHDVMVDRIVGEAGRQVVIEEKLKGEEVSVLALSDGETVVSLLSAQDHKRVGDGDTGPNTGGMGAYSPVPRFDQAFLKQVHDTILLPTVRAMASEGHPYKGVLYAGLMVDQGKPEVLEYNVRFGDPETQVILPLLESDLVDLAFACIEGNLASHSLRWRGGAALTIVLASEGYPGSYPKGRPISGLSQVAQMSDVVVFHAGTALKDGNVITSGGRVLNVVGMGSDMRSAQCKAYEAVSRIRFDGVYYRKDIGWRALA